MLKQRVITAAILLLILVATLFSGFQWPFGVLLSILTACAIWEWLRLSLPERFGFAAIAIALLALLYFLYVLYLHEQYLFDLSMPAAQNWTKALLLLSPAVLAYWFFGVGFMLLTAQTSERSHNITLSIFGVLTLGVAWLALLDMWFVHGAWYLISMLAVVWATDTAAYFTGRQWGQRRLARRISPGKTWAGFWGGMAGAVLWVLISAQFVGSFGYELVERWGWLGAVLLTLLLSFMSVVGDLFESLLKRRAGLKDSSNLLPGHGGVLDRIDALIPVAPMAAFIAGPWYDALFVA